MIHMEWQILFSLKKNKNKKKWYDNYRTSSGTILPDYTPFMLGLCLSVWTFLILPLCISTMISLEYDFGIKG